MGVRLEFTAESTEVLCYVRPGSVAERAGLISGSQLLTVNGFVITGLSPLEVESLVKGSRPVTIVVVPPGGGGAADGTSAARATAAAHATTTDDVSKLQMAMAQTPVTQVAQAAQAAKTERKSDGTSADGLSRLETSMRESISVEEVEARVHGLETMGSEAAANEAIAAAQEAAEVVSLSSFSADTAQVVVHLAKKEAAEAAAMAAEKGAAAAAAAAAAVAAADAAGEALDAAVEALDDAAAGGAAAGCAAAGCAAAAGAAAAGDHLPSSQSGEERSSPAVVQLAESPTETAAAVGWPLSPAAGTTAPAVSDLQSADHPHPTSSSSVSRAVRRAIAARGRPTMPYFYRASPMAVQTTRRSLRASAPAKSKVLPPYQPPVAQEGIPTAQPPPVPPPRLLLTPPPASLGRVTSQGWLRQRLARKVHSTRWQWRWCVLAADELRGFAFVEDVYNGASPPAHFSLRDVEVTPAVRVASGRGRASAKEWRIVLRSAVSSSVAVVEAPDALAFERWLRRLQVASRGKTHASATPTDTFDDEDPDGWGVPLEAQKKRRPRSPTGGPTKRPKQKPPSLVTIQPTRAASIPAND